ncbi:MAG: hypothetical protein WD768_14030 [Phycisphaeraceae bacterium]
MQLLSHALRAAFAACLIIGAVNGLARAEGPIVQVPTLYEATARFQVVDASTDLVLDKPGMMSRAYQRMRVTRTYDITRTKSIEAVVVAEKWDKDFPRLDDGELTAFGKTRFRALVGRIQKNVTVRSEAAGEGVEIIAVIVRDTDPDRAAAIANKLGENYLRQVRKELDDQLLTAKKKCDGEVTRYGRMVNELNLALYRFYQKESTTRLWGRVGLPSQDEIAMELREVKENTQVKSARQRVERLVEAGKDRNTGDAYVIELARLRSELDAAEVRAAERAERQEPLEILQRNYFIVLHEERRILGQLEDAQARLAFWSAKVRECELELVLAVSDFGVRLTWLEWATEGELVVE